MSTDDKPEVDFGVKTAGLPACKWYKNNTPVSKVRISGVCVSTHPVHIKPQVQNVRERMSGGSRGVGRVKQAMDFDPGGQGSWLA